MTTAASDLKVLSWNLRWQGLLGRLPRVLDAILSERPDVVTLQEVASEHRTALVEGLRAGGLEHHVSSWVGTTTPRGRPIAHGVFIGSRSRLSSDHELAQGARYPDLFARARMAWGDAFVDVITVHIPNGAMNGWTKVEHLDLLARRLQRAPDGPRIVTGDFNEPRAFCAGGQIQSWATADRADGGVEPARPDGLDDSRPLSDFDRAARDVLGCTAHGLRNAYEVMHGMVPTPVTHRTSAGNPRCFDHALLSRHFDVVSCAYRHDWRTSGLSEHSALVANVRFTAHGSLAAWSEE